MSRCFVCKCLLLSGLLLMRSRLSWYQERGVIASCHQTPGIFIFPPWLVQNRNEYKWPHHQERDNKLTFTLRACARLSIPISLGPTLELKVETSRQHSLAGCCEKNNEMWRIYVCITTAHTHALGAVYVKLWMGCGCFCLKPKWGSADMHQALRRLCSSKLLNFAKYAG